MHFLCLDGTIRVMQWVDILIKVLIIASAQIYESKLVITIFLRVTIGSITVMIAEIVGNTPFDK